jgi:hypothetical protein
MDRVVIDIGAWCSEHLDHAHVGSKEASANCPWCGRGKGGFRVNLESGLFRCYKCHDRYQASDESRSWGFFPRLVAKVENITVGEAARRCFGGASTGWSPDPKLAEESEPDEATALVWNPIPPEAVECFDPLRLREWMVPKYLDARLDRETIAAFDLCYATTGRYAGRVIIPIRCPNGISLTARQIGEGDPRYLNPEDAGFERLLFGWSALPSPLTKLRLIVVVEGPFDCMRLHQHGIQSIALLGKHASETQVGLLARLAAGGTSIVILLDPEERAEQHNLARALAAFSEVRIAKLPEGIDPGDSSAEQAWEAIMTSAQWIGRSSEIDDLMKKVESRLRSRR